MIVVTGATGNVGRSLVRTLLAAGEKVTAVSRTAEDPRHRADLAAPETLRPVLDGADALFLLVPAPTLEASAVIEAVAASGVRRVVLMSSLGARTRPSSPSHAPLRAVEDELRATDLDWTVLRPGGFQSNAFAWAASVRESRTISAPFADVALPHIHPIDIADVAAASLLDPSHIGKTYELTGPEPLTPRAQAAILADVLGEPIAFSEQTREEAHAQMLTFMPAPFVDGTLDIIGSPTDEERRVSPDSAALLPHPPRTFADWARENAAAFR
ncbi:SDR family oxidoreductase [Actinomadura atramentaria]|uniref:SDR family oxidoreductase n=1 Tax=Actinomadura atramentaria TaxID=1990 RepID=UPI000363CF6B|nr:NAD(P)H-binding protein [Actinomadura atramentaria]